MSASGPAPTVAKDRPGRSGFASQAIRSILIDMGVKPSHVRIAMDREQLTGEPLSRIMLDFGFLSGEQVAEALARQFDIPYFSANKVDQIDPAELRGISFRKFNNYVPVGRNADGDLVVAIPDATVMNEARNYFFTQTPPLRATFQMASDHVIQNVYRHYFARTEEAVDDAIARYREAAARTRKGEEEDAGLVRQVWLTLIRHACYSGASDIYLYKSEKAGLIKLKINGVGQMFRIIDDQLFERLLNKLVSENSVKAEELRREPKEAIVSFHKDDEAAHGDISSRFAFRLELTESRGTRNAVIRILDRQASTTELERLGFDPDTYRAIRRISSIATGLFLVTGPTGSGKTTTLYAVLKRIDPVERSVQAIENPIEYRHGLWQQYEIRKDGSSSEGEEYNKWLKALLRNAPDVILVGEVRDTGVAQILLDAANTGHLAFATLHTNNAAMALARLKALHVDMNTLASVLVGILAQRLVRLLCPKCRQPDTSPETAAALKAPYLAGATPTPFKAGEGCEYCGYTSYRGRRMVYELLEVEHEVQQLIETDSTPSQIARAGIPPDRTMWACGLRLVATGITSLEELQRVAKEDV